MENKQSCEGSCTHSWPAWTLGFGFARGHQLFTPRRWWVASKAIRPGAGIDTAAPEFCIPLSLGPVLAGNNPVLPASQQWCQVWLMCSDLNNKLLLLFWLWMSKTYSLFPLLSLLPLLVLFTRLDTPFLHLSLLPKEQLWLSYLLLFGPNFAPTSEIWFLIGWYRHRQLYMWLLLEQLRCCGFGRAVLPKSFSAPCHSSVNFNHFSCNSTCKSQPSLGASSVTCVRGLCWHLPHPACSLLCPAVSPVLLCSLSPSSGQELKHRYPCIPRDLCYTKIGCRPLYPWLQYLCFWLFMTGSLHVWVLVGCPQMQTHSYASTHLAYCWVLPTHLSIMLPVSVCAQGKS